MGGGLGVWVRGLLKGSERDTARMWHAATEHARDADNHARREGFLRELRCNPADHHIRLGRAMSLMGDYLWCGMSLARLCAMHLGFSGATGTGKSFLIAVLLYQLLLQRVPLITADMKSELTELLLEVVIPAVIASGREDLLDQVRVIRPFEAGRVPLLRLTEPEPDVSPQVQSLNIAQSLCEAAGHEMGLRLLRILLPLTGFAVEQNLPLPIISEWLRSPETFARAASGSVDPMIRAYALHELPRENRASLNALRARLDLIFHLPEVREALSAPRCISFHECLGSGITILDFGSPPGGAEAAMKFIAGPVVGRLGRAILSRKMHPDTAPAIACFEEVQELLGSYQIEMFKRLIALCRFKRVSLWFSNQQPAQIAEADRTLLRILRTNLGAECIFRSSVEDARVLSEGLSTRLRDETQMQARSRMTEEIATLPQRSFFLWLRDSRFGPQQLRSPRLDLDALRQAASSLSSEQRERIRLGSASIARSTGDVVPPQTVVEPDLRVAPLEPDNRRRTPRLG
jgi:hypothetical protein